MSPTHILTATCRIGNVSYFQRCRPDGSVDVGVVIKSSSTVFGSSFSSKPIRQSKGSSEVPVGKEVAGLSFSYVSRYSIKKSAHLIMLNHTWLQLLLVTVPLSQQGL